MIPKTNFILNGLRDFYIDRVDPSRLSKDPVEGLKEKERKLATITHEYLDKNIKNYEEKEEKVFKDLGNNFSKLLLGQIDREDLIKKKNNGTNIKGI